MRFKLARVHLPSFGVAALALGGVLRLFSMLFAWPLILVIISEIILLLSVGWIVMFDFFPLFLPIFETIKTRYPKKYSFFFGLLVLFALMQGIAHFLPSSTTKDITTTVGFLSFMASMFWIMTIYLAYMFGPFRKYLKRKPKDAERVSFADIITSLAVIIFPTVALSFFFTPPGLANQGITPKQVFLYGLLTNSFMLAYLYLFVIRTRVFTWKQLGLRRVSRDHILKSFLHFLLIAIAIVVVEVLLERFHVRISQYRFTGKEGAYLALALSIIVTPIVEELYFRGFLFRGLQSHHRLWIAYGASALIFALLHPPLIVMLETFIIGLLLAYLTQETKSVFPAIVIHAINNAVVMSFLLYR